MTRIARLRADLKDETHEPPMPPADAAGHVVAYLMEIGPVMPGPAAITHAEIAHWQRNTGIELEPWQARFIRALSLEYLAEAACAEDPKAPPPWLPDLSPTQRAVVAAGMKNAIRGLAQL